MDHREFSRKGGQHSRKNMTPEEATKVSRKALRARWAKYRAQKRAEKKAAKDAQKKNES